MRILFVLNRMAHVRHFDRALRLLADRGHDVCLASQDDDVELRGVLAGHPRIAAADAPRNRADDWSAHVTALRRARDYTRYLHPRYAGAHLLRARAFEKLVRAISGPSRDIGAGWSEVLLGVNTVEQKRLDALLARLETTIPSDPAIDAFVAAQRPDALVLSPMVGIGFSQADFVKSARRSGIPTGMLVFSWDNLSNKGLIHEMPDRMFVWNTIQRREAEKLHGYPIDQVVVTGAARFDELFEMRPATTRQEFCGLVGVEPSRPIVVYLCSSKFVAAGERAFVDRWIGELRRSADRAAASGSDGFLARAGADGPPLAGAQGQGGGLEVARRCACAGLELADAERGSGAVRHRLSRCRRRRPQHQRGNRGGNHRTPGLHDRRSGGRRAAGHTAFPLPAERPWRARQAGRKLRRAPRATLERARRRR